MLTNMTYTVGMLMRTEGHNSIKDLMKHNIYSGGKGGEGEAQRLNYTCRTLCSV